MPKQQLDDGQTRAAKVKREVRRSYQRQVARTRFLRNPIGSLLLLVGLLILLAVSMTTNTLFQATNTLKATVSFQEILIAALIAMSILLVFCIVLLLLFWFFFGRNEKGKLPPLVHIDEPAWDRRKLAFYAALQQRSSENFTIFSIRIIEEPLTAQNVATLVSAFTEFYVKCWLIAQHRFADLVEFTQTHAQQFSEEAGLVISKISYNSPLNIDWKVDASMQGLVDALVTAVDGVAQTRQRYEKAELENREKEQQINQQALKADKEIQGMELENEKATLEIEKQRLELLEKRLDVQKKGIEYALEIARKTVDVLHPNADSETRAMIIQTLLPNILQFQNGKGLELALPAPQNGKNEGKEQK